MGSISLKYKSKSGNLTAPGDVDPGAMIPLTTTTLSTNTATVTFSSIPQNYEHLQIRFIARCTATQVSRNITTQINGDTGSNYSRHYLSGNGSAASSGPDIGQTVIFGGVATGTGGAANVFGVNVFDILDYTNTNKYKTFRIMSGYDDNTQGQAYYNSGLWLSTSAITSITLSTEGSFSFSQYSTFALYGIKRAGA